jgi:hypothetical protein
MPGAVHKPLEDAAIAPASRTAWLAAGGVILIFLALIVAESLTQSPWMDEGMFADVAFSFRNFGHLGSSVLAPYGYQELPGVHQYTYWQFPLYFMALGSWFRVLPVTAVWMRLFSVAWGFVFITSWFVFVRSLSRKESLALLTASLIALDYAVLVTASNGRMDMMCAALGMAGLASYSRHRDSNWPLGVIFAAWFGAASLFTHPMGAVMNVALAAMVVADWRHIRWGAIAAATVPYLIGIGLCFSYIHEAPELFHAQSRAASQYRVSGFGPILYNILNDVTARYFRYYFTAYTGISKSKIVALLFPVWGLIGLLLDRNLRSQLIAKRLLLLLVVTYVGVAIVDNQKFGNYLVFSLPVVTACAAVWFYARWQLGGRGRLLVSAVLALSVLATLAGIGYKISRNEYGRVYDPAVAAARAALPAGGTLMGGSELGFAFGFGPPLVDDRYLGYFSGSLPEVFVINDHYGPMRSSPRLTSAWEASRITLLNQYHLVFKNSMYQIYVRNDVAAPHTRANKQSPFDGVPILEPVSVWDAGW